MKINEQQTILLVEDNPDDREAIVRAFFKAGINNPIKWCKNGQDALDYLFQLGSYIKKNAHTMPCMVILDLNMPGIDGRQLLTFLKNSEKLQTIPVIVFSTSTDERDILYAYQTGANSYIQKPVTFDVTVQIVEKIRDFWFDLTLVPESKYDET